MKKIVSGNFDELAPEHRGWVWGHFMDPKSVMHSNDIEIKWSRLKKGDKKEITGINTTAQTLHITIEGRFKINFPDQNLTLSTKNKGDFIFYDNNISHTWEALTDCLCIIIRWPSIPNDQITKPRCNK